MSSKPEKLDIFNMNLTQLMGLFLTEQDFDYLITEARKIKREDARNEVARVLKEMLEAVSKINIQIDKAFLKLAFNFVASLRDFRRTAIESNDLTTLAYIWVFWKLRLINTDLTQVFTAKGWY